MSVFTDSVVQYLQDNFGDAYFFLEHNDMSLSMRFYMSLNENDQWILDNSKFDPVKWDSESAVKYAIQVLKDFGAA